MKQFASDVGFALVVGAIYAAVAVASVIVAVVYGWVWAIRVLTGNIKVGPNTTWGDQIARRDFAARRIELKVSLGILACYLSFTILVIMMLTPITQGDWDFPIRLGVFAASFLTFFFVGMILAVFWREEWWRVYRRIAARALDPVLF